MPDQTLMARPQPEPAALMEQAEAKFQLADYASAAADYAALLAVEPEHLPATLGLARCARMIGDAAAAVRHLQAACRIDPGDPWPLLDLAQLWREGAEFEQAEQAYRQVVVLARDNVQAWLGLGQCARQRGDRAAALTYFQAGRLAAPDNPWPLLEAAIDLRETGALAAAEAAFREVLALAPEIIHAHLGLGHCLRAKRDHDAALARFEAAIALAPNDPWPLLEAANSLRDLGRAAAAAQTYRRVLALMPGNVHAHLGLGHCLRDSGDRAASHAQFSAGIAAAPDDPWPRLEAAIDLRELGDLDGAEAGFHEVLRMMPGNVQAYLGLGHCARLRGDRRAALALFDHGAVIAPGDPWPRLEAAAELRELGRLDQADAICREVLARHPGQAAAYTGLGYGARLRGDGGAAVAHFRAAAAANPDDITAWIEIAAEQRESGDPEAAQATAREILQRHPNHLQAWLSIGAAARYAGQHEAALAAFREAHEAAPGQAGPLVEMAIEERSLGRQAVCDALLGQALALDPRNVSAIIRQGETALITGDAEQAHELYMRAAAEQPGQAEFRFGIAETLAALGQIGAAVSYLTAWEEQRGKLPRIDAKRLNLLRRCGDYYGGLRQARVAAAAFPHYFEIWSERFQFEILLATEAEIETCLAGMPAGTQAEAGIMHRFRGNLAEARWLTGEAVEHYQAAAALRPLDAGIQHDLVRTRMLLLDVAGGRRHLRKFCELTAFVTRLQGKSLNVSQTHYGQIIDDYCLDAPLLAALTDAALLPGPARATAFAAITRDNPDSTAAAVSLLVAMRQAGAFDRGATGAGLGGIGKQLTQFWDAAQVPADVAALMQSWGECNPDYTFARFNDATARAFLFRRYPPPVLQAYRRVREPAQKADIFRLAYLAAEGGVYGDADDRCLAPLGGIIPAQAELVLYQEDHGTVGNNFVAARPDHPVLRTALWLAVEAINRGDTDNVWLSTGPALMTRAFAQWLAGQAGAVPAGVVVLHRRQLFTTVAIHCAADYKRGDRHWSNTAFARRREAVTIN